MRGRILFVTGAAIGYVLGTRAGRKRYEQIKAAADRVWQTPAIQRQVHQAQEYTARKVGEVPGVILDGVAKAVSSAVQKAAGGSRPADAPARSAVAGTSDGSVPTEGGSASDTSGDTASDTDGTTSGS